MARALVPLIRLWTPWQRKIFVEQLGGTLAPDNVAFLHDPLAVLSLVDESALRFETLRIVPTSRTACSVPSRLARRRLGAAMEVATGVDAAAAREAIISDCCRDSATSVMGGVNPAGSALDQRR